MEVNRGKYLKFWLSNYIHDLRYSYWMIIKIKKDKGVISLTINPLPKIFLWMSMVYQKNLKVYHISLVMQEEN